MKHRQEPRDNTPIVSPVFSLRSDAQLFRWLDEHDIVWEMHEDPYNPRRDTLTLYASEELVLVRGNCVVKSGDIIEVRAEL